MPVIGHKFKLLFYHCLVAAVLLLAFTACRDSTEPKVSETSGSTSTPGVSSSPSVAATADLPVIVAFGDSLTAGFGLPEKQSFYALLQQKIDDNGYRFRVINAGVSGDTTAGGVRRIDWVLEENVKFLILELGANDGMRGQPVSEMKKNLARIIERAQSRGVTVILAGMEAPPNMGSDYTRAFRQVYQDLARQYKLAFIPFVLEGIGGLTEFNQADGIHPNAEGEKIMTENVWRVLEPLLKPQ